MIAALPIILTVRTRLEMTFVALKHASREEGLGGDPFYIVIIFIIVIIVF